MRTPPLIPPERRRFFYALIEGEYAPYNYKINRQADADDREAGLSDKHGIYLRLALATLDVGLGAPAAGRLLGESAFAAKLSMETDPTFLPMNALEALFAFQAVVAVAPTQAFARLLAERPTPKRGSEMWGPHMETLVKALAFAILGEGKQVAATLAALAKLGPLRSSRKSGRPWFESMRTLATACLLGKPADLAPALLAVAKWTNAYRGRGFEDQDFEACLATMALAFVAHARDRAGFDVSGPGPHPSMPFELLRLRRGPLPRHPWHTWPPPSQALRRRVKDAFKRAGAPAGSAGRRARSRS